MTHARLGEAAFGISPGYAEIWATLRTLTDERMADLVARAEALVAKEAAGAGLKVTIGYEDVFHQCSNADVAACALERAMDEEGVSHDKGEGVLPMKGSEDFGLFGRGALRQPRCSSSAPVKTMRGCTIQTMTFPTT